MSQDQEQDFPEQEPEVADGREVALLRSEETVLASLLTGHGEEIPTTISRLLDFSPESFMVPDNGTIAQAIQRCRNNGKCPEYLDVLRKLTGTPVEVAQHLANGSMAINLTLAEAEAEPLLDRWRSRKLISTLGEAWEQARKTPDLCKAIGKCTITTIKTVMSDMPDGDLPPILDATDFISKPLVKPPEIICGLLHKKSKMIVGGGSKSFKTWVQLDMALSIAFGVQWMGFNCIRGRVLFVNFEIDDSFFQERMLRMAQAKDINYAPGWIDVWNLRGKAAPYNILIPKILERTRDSNYALIILDPVYKLYGQTDENSASGVAQLLNSFEHLTVESGSAVGFGAHYSKGNQSGKESIDRVSGSGVFARDPDTIINFTQHEEKNSFTIEPVLRNLPPVEPFVVTWEFPLMRRDDELDPSKLKKPGGRPKTYNEDEVWALLSEKSLTTTEWEAVAKGELGVSRSRFFIIKKSLQDQGRVLLSQINGKWVQVTPKSKP